jgi:hypothetical protein
MSNEIQDKVIGIWDVSDTHYTTYTQYLDEDLQVTRIEFETLRYQRDEDIDNEPNRTK